MLLGLRCPLHILRSFGSSFRAVASVGRQAPPAQVNVMLSRSDSSSLPDLSLRTTITGQWACPTTESETLPIKARLIPPLDSTMLGASSYIRASQLSPRS